MDATVTGAMEPMSSLLDKLEEKHKDGKFLNKEWKSIQALLRMVGLGDPGEAPPDHLDDQVRAWALELRRLSYSIEDIVRDFMLSEEGLQQPASPKCSKGLRKNKDKTTRQIAADIRYIKSKVRVIAEKRPRCTIDGLIRKPIVSSADDLCRSTIYPQVKELVGIDQATDELIKRLTQGSDEVSDQQLKIVSLVGCEGLGKTALANVVYHKLKPQFEFSASVSLSSNPNMIQVLKNMLYQLDKEKQWDIIDESWDQAKLVNELKEFLQDKRFVVVIDDIRDMKAWEIISRGFLDSNVGGRIISTTRYFDLAIKTSDIYKLEPLSHDNSEELFYRILSGGKGKQPIDQPPEVSNRILQQCDGIPLAIIKIASLLAGKPREDWSKVCSSAGFRYGDDADDENKKNIFLSRYYDLPDYLRTCLLHLSIFPKNCDIRKDNLIWMWIAEGFVHTEPGITLFEIGERYFDELMHRSMIQSAKTPHHVISCRVDDLVHDIISSLSKEENFVTVLRSNSDFPLTSSPRRLAIHKDIWDHSMDKIRAPHARSLNGTKCDFGHQFPPLSNFQFLRVLALEDCYSMRYHVDHPERLHQLRYLQLQNMSIRMLSRKIGNLRFLHTLDLSGNKIYSLPQSVGQLRQLKCLRIGARGTRWAEDWIGRLTSLEELSLDDLDAFPSCVKELGKLTELRDLKIGGMNKSCKIPLVVSLRNLQKIQVLKLEGRDWSSVEDDMWESYVPPRQLYHLSLEINFSRLPAWINSSCLPNLLHLVVTVNDVEAQGVVKDILGSFRELITLELLMPENVFLEVAGGDAFPKLKHCKTATPLTFLGGAMPSLESLQFNIKVRALKDAKFDFSFCGLSNLRRLQEVTVQMDCSGASATEVQKAEEAVKDAVQVHPNGRSIEITGITEPEADLVEEPEADLVEELSAPRWLLWEPIGTSLQ